MTTLYQITSRFIGLGLFLGVTGGLASATIYLGQEAAKSSSSGLVSLTALNHQLMGKSKHRLNR